MTNIAGDELIHNFRKITDKYQELLLYFIKGKGNLIPAGLVDNDKATILFTGAYEQFTRHPEKFLQVNLEYMQKFQELMTNTMTKFAGQEAEPLFTPDSRDKRFRDDSWQENAYFDFIKQFYLMSSEYLQKSIEQYQLDPEIKKYLEFITKQFINALSPTNFILCNPQVLRESLSSGWQNIVRGLDHFLEDIKKSEDVLNIATTDKAAFKIGENIAETKGKVVFQNDLIQLICYEPQHKTRAIPLLIIPPWINKYYILDLSEHNSMVSYLVKNNFQVFMVSWVNPDSKLGDKDFADYLQEGILEPCEYIKKLGYEKINATGYCIGGTLLAVAGAYLNSQNINYINSATFLTTLLDFTDPGELGVFINESSIAVIEKNMHKKGYFDGKYLCNNFSLLRANDLVWSFFINNYLLGKTPMPFDILYWNSDPTNLPAKMHSYYLRNMYLNNLLKTPDKLKILGQNINLGKIECPTFFVAAQDDHIAPWKSVYNSAKLVGGDKTFCLTSSGHVAGIINPPAASKYSYKISKTFPTTTQQWLDSSDDFSGSWWPAWQQWLANNSGKLQKSISYADLDFLEEAPGSYVRTSILN